MFSGPLWKIRLPPPGTTSGGNFKSAATDSLSLGDEGRGEGGQVPKQISSLRPLKTLENHGPSFLLS